MIQNLLPALQTLSQIVPCQSFGFLASLDGGVLSAVFIIIILLLFIQRCFLPHVLG